jgi:PDZ domain-containing protein
MTSPPEPPAAATEVVVPPGPAAPIDPPDRRTPWFGKLAIGLALLAAVIGVVGANITLPYVIFSPGDATPVDDYLRINDVRTYRHSGSLLLLTVRVSRGQPNLWRFIQASMDDDSQVVGEEKVYGTTPRKKADRIDVQRMEESQVAAQQAALTRLGYDVRVTGEGAQITQVVKGSPAATAGLRPGDVITAIDGQPVQVVDDVGTIVRAQPAGTTFTVTVRRGEDTKTVPVTSAIAPSGSIKGRPYFGIGAQTDQPDVDFPVDIDIDTRDVSGPSGGLAFALTIIDDLTPGNLTGGKKVAVSGTIDGAGTVGEVGGVAQKAVAARAAGARLMLVPRPEVAAARRKAGDIKVVGVRTLDEALDVLDANGGTAIPPRAA